MRARGLLIEQGRDTHESASAAVPDRHGASVRCAHVTSDKSPNDKLCEGRTALLVDRPASVDLNSDSTLGELIKDRGRQAPKGRGLNRCGYVVVALWHVRPHSPTVWIIDGGFTRKRFETKQLPVASLADA